MKKLMLAAAFSMLAVPSAAQAACGPVSVAEMNWASGAILSKITRLLMQVGYGCDVTIVPTSTVPSITSVAENNEPDVVVELWVNSAPLYKKLEAQGKIAKAADVIAEGGLEAWWIPSYLAKKHPELKTLQGVLDNPELVGGRFHNCPVGWGCRNHNDNLIKAFGVEGSGIEIFNHGSGETLATSMAAAYEAGEPWFGYYWGPTALLGKYEMVQVDMGPVDDDAFACNANPDCGNPGRTSYKAAEVITAVTTDFASREPDAAELVSNISISNGVLSSVLAWQEANNASAAEAATYFLANNRSVWGSWLNADARRKFGFRN